MTRDPEAMRAGGSSRLVRTGPDGRLIYDMDEDGNRIVDFSYAGYRGGGVRIPDVPVVATLDPQPDGGDDTARIQAAVDRVGALPVQADGFRGALLLRRGKYTVSRTIHLRHGGVVVRGEGAGFGGTWIYHRLLDPIPDPTPAQYIHWPQVEKGMAPTFLSSGGQAPLTRKIAEVLDPLLPAGSRRLRLDRTAGLAVGDEILVLCTHTGKWVDALGLAKLWKPREFTLRFPRTVAEIHPDSREIVLNVPLTSRIDREGGLAAAEVHEIEEERRLERLGIEDILCLSAYDRSRTDPHGFFNHEHHANYVFRFSNARDGWMRRCVGFFYSCGMVSTGGSQHLTIEDCAMIDGVSGDTPRTHVGSRKYYFNAQGEMLLFQRCYGRHARHAFIGNGPVGGAVWLDCLSERDHLKNEWHQRWGHGHLFDNLLCEAQIGMAGNPSSHGQKAAFAVAWNNLIDNRRTYEVDLYVNRLGGLFQNYAIGNILRGSRRIGHDALGEVGLVESDGRFVEPRSLYLAQLRDRLGPEAVANVATAPQIGGPRGAVWQELIAAFAGFPEWPDPDQAPWPGYERWLPEFTPPAARAGHGKEAPVTISVAAMPSAPPGAVAGTLERLAFREEFHDASAMDLEDTRRPGFRFYPKLIWGGYVLPAAHIQVRDGVLHLFNPDNHAQGDLFSAVTTGNPGEWHGFTAGREHGGAYFEASIAFDPEAGPVDGFPAFWTMAAEHFFGNLEPKPYRFLEIDFMEYNPKWVSDPTHYLHANHVWTFTPDGKRHRETYPKPYQRQVIATPPGTDYTRFNTFGCLWVPGEDGRIDTYFNDRLLRSVPFREYPELRVGDDLHYPVILGCGQWPMRVDWVRVWTR
ncbi:MAG: hypothetical protein JXR77_16335 [Lentisphaeria bacterium]|nr:hypothetical protein [Lentisphaeria bacterium]